MDKFATFIFALAILACAAVVGMEYQSMHDLRTQIAGQAAELEKARAATAKAGKTAQVAMATGSMWMTEHHLHEIEEALEKSPVDWEEAEEETEELIAWLSGAEWPAGAKEAAEELIATVGPLEEAAKARDVSLTAARLEVTEEAYSHLHHEVMEIVAEQGGHGGHSGH